MNVKLIRICLLIIILFIAQNFCGFVQSSSLEIHPAAEVVSIRDSGPLQFDKVIRARDGGYSSRFKDRSVWLFGDTVLTEPGHDGNNWLSSSWCWTKDFDAHDGIENLIEPIDETGVPDEFLPFTDEELAYNKVHFRQDMPARERSRYALWPGPVIVDPNRNSALVFYAKLKAGGKGPFDFNVLGNSLAVWKSPDTKLIRPKVKPGSDDETLLFPKGDIHIGQGALVVDDWIYVYGCDTHKDDKGVSWPCYVGRVKFKDALKRKAWQFYAGDNRWSQDFKEAISIMDAAPMLSVHWNEHLKKYLSVYSKQLVNKIAIRTAERPEGPWSDAQVVLECIAPTNEKMWSYCGLAHPEFSREAGRIEYLTYYRETGFLKGEIRLIELTFK
jgi:hypothetical protein